MTQRTCNTPRCDQPIPTGSNSTACPGCWNRLHRDLTQMPHLTHELHLTLTRQTATTTDTGPRNTETPLPYHAGASNALTLIHTTLWGWVRELLQNKPTTPTPTPSIRGLTNTLLDNYTWLRNHPNGHQAIDEITHTINQATRIIDRPAERISLGKCFADPLNQGIYCQADLSCRLGDHVARCQECGSEWEVEDKKAWLLDLSRETLVTRSEGLGYIGLCGMTPVVDTTIWRWKTRGRLIVQGHTPDGHELFRMGDLVDLHATG